MSINPIVTGSIDPVGASNSLTRLSINLEELPATLHTKVMYGSDPAAVWELLRDYLCQTSGDSLTVTIFWSTFTTDIRRPVARSRTLIVESPFKNPVCVWGHS